MYLLEKVGSLDSDHEYSFYGICVFFFFMNENAHKKIAAVERGECILERGEAVHNPTID